VSSFWKTVPGEDSSDEDLYSSESESEEEVKETPKPKPASKFQVDLDSSDEEEEKRTVRSASEKKEDEMKKIIKKIQNQMNINDWNAIYTEWEKLNKVLSKNTSTKKEAIPRFYIRIMVQIEDFMKKTFENKDRKMNAINAKSLNTMKQKLKKWLKARPDVEKAMEEFRKNPQDSDDEKEDDKKKGGKGGAAADDKKAAAGGPVKTGPTIGAGGKDISKWLKKPGSKSDSDDSDSDSDDWDPDADSDDDVVPKKNNKHKDSDMSDSEDDKWKSGKKDKTKKKDDKNKSDAKPEEEEDKNKAAEEKKKEEVWNFEKVEAKLKELLAQRGKKSYDRLKQVEKLAFLLDKAMGSAQVMRIQFAIIDAQFDATANTTSHMPVTMWRSAFNDLTRAVASLNELGESVTLKEAPLLNWDQDGEDDDFSLRSSAASVGLAASTSVPASLNASSAVRSNEVAGHLTTSVEKLDAELIKSLQFIDPSSLDYRVRLGDESQFLKLAKFVQEYYESQANSGPAPSSGPSIYERLARISARRLEHLYYKRDTGRAAKVTDAPSAPNSASLVLVTREGVSNKELMGTLNHISNTTVIAVPVAVDISGVSAHTSLTEEVEDLCQKIYRWGDDRLKRTAMLQQIYFMAQHDRFFAARDLLLMSHLQDTIQHADIPTQILFNRTMTQLGLAAFRHGRILDAHQCLTDLVSGGKMKELLAQGINIKSHQEKTPEQERQERRRQIPYHMHINLELIETVHLISAMLLEVPNMALNAFDTKKKVISKNFRRVFDWYDRQVFMGPPENTREHVIAASKLLLKGDWHAAADLLLGLNIWKLLPNDKEIKELLRRKLQEEGLRTYLFTYSAYYDAISLKELASLFELPTNVVHSIVSKLIISEELHASWDQPNSILVLHRAEPSRLQYLALHFGEKAGVLVESDQQEERDNRGNRNYGQGQGQQGGQQGYSDQRRGPRNQSNYRGQNRRPGNVFVPRNKNRF
jgi:translation initiation factor 3 subunit C